MADYRLECSTPGCTFTGFTGHSPHCPVPFNIAARLRQDRINKESEERGRRSKYESLSDDEAAALLADMASALRELRKVTYELQKEFDSLKGAASSAAYNMWRNGVDVGR